MSIANTPEAGNQAGRAASQPKRLRRHFPACIVLAVLTGSLLLVGCGQQATSSEPPSEIVNPTQDQQAQTQKKAPAPEPAGKLDGFTVCIDAGHGDTVSTKSYPNNPDEDESEDGIVQPLGTSGEESGNEYAVNLKVAKLLQKDLEDEGAEVVMVRTTNDVVISPKKRALIANDCDADLFIRLHCDSAGSSTRGFLTLLPANTGYQADGGLYKKSQTMGEQMHEQIVEELGCNDRGCTVRSDQGGFNWCKVPCVLFEMANMDNAKDDALLATESYQSELASAIAHATVNYLTGE